MLSSALLLTSEATFKIYACRMSGKSFKIKKTMDATLLNFLPVTMNEVWHDALWHPERLQMY